jgi:hypothetical protein
VVRGDVFAVVVFFAAVFVALGAVVALVAVVVLAAVVALVGTAFRPDESVLASSAESAVEDPRTADLVADLFATAAPAADFFVTVGFATAAVALRLTGVDPVAGTAVPRPRSGCSAAAFFGPPTEPLPALPAFDADFGPDGACPATPAFSAMASPTYKTGHGILAAHPKAGKNTEPKGVRQTCHTI